MLTSPSPSRTCLGKTLLYQLLIVWAFLDTLAQTLGGGGRGLALLSLGTVELQAIHPGPAPITVVFLRARQRGAWVSLPVGPQHLPRGPPGAGSGLQLSSFCRILAARPRPGSLNTSAKRCAETDSLSHKAGRFCGCCRTCFWGESSSPTSRVFIHMKKACVCFVR